MKFTAKKRLMIAMKGTTVEFRDGVYNCTSPVIEKKLREHPRFGKDFFAEEGTIKRKTVKNEY